MTSSQHLVLDLAANVARGSRDGHGAGAHEPQRARTVIARDASGQPRTFRLVPTTNQHTAYRRLAVAIVRLDVASLAAELRSARRATLARAA